MDSFVCVPFYRFFSIFQWAATPKSLPISLPTRTKLKLVRMFHLSLFLSTNKQKCLVFSMSLSSLYFSVYFKGYFIDVIYDFVANTQNLSTPLNSLSCAKHKTKFLKCFPLLFHFSFLFFSSPTEKKTWRVFVCWNITSMRFLVPRQSINIFLASPPPRHSLIECL